MYVKMHKQNMQLYSIETNILLQWTCYAHVNTEKKRKWARERERFVFCETWIVCIDHQRIGKSRGSNVIVLWLPGSIYRTICAWLGRQRDIHGGLLFGFKMMTHRSAKSNLN